MVGAKEIGVIILAPNELYRLAWQSLLSTHPYIESVQVAASIPAVKTLLHAKRRNVILVDAPGSEMRFSAELQSLNQQFATLLVVDDCDLHTIISYLTAGAMGFIRRNDSASALAQVIQKCARGEIALPSSLTTPGKPVLRSGNGAQSKPTDCLTVRELEVLQLLMHGMSNKDIAQSLFLSVRTVEAHLRNVYAKLDVSCRIEAALWAIRNGYAVL